MLGVGIVASTFFDAQKDVVMKPGDIQTLGKYTFKYVGVEEHIYPDRLEEIATFQAWRGDKNVGLMYPKRSFYPEFRISSTRGAILTSPIEDFYLIPSEFREDGQAVFRVLINPMVWWMWASGPFLIGGTLFSLSPGRKRKKRQTLKSRIDNLSSLRVVETGQEP